MLVSFSFCCGASGSGQVAACAGEEAVLAPPFSETHKWRLLALEVMREEILYKAGYTEDMSILEVFDNWFLNDPY